MLTLSCLHLEMRIRLSMLILSLFVAGPAGVLDMREGNSSLVLYFLILPSLIDKNVPIDR